MEEKNNQIIVTASQQSLIQDLRQIINQARGHVAATANYELTMMYWHIGKRINREVLDNQRAEYGKQIVAQVARQFKMVSPLVSKLSWTHLAKARFDNYGEEDEV
jgi:hypothetical protein